MKRKNVYVRVGSAATGDIYSPLCSVGTLTRKETRFFSLLPLPKCGGSPPPPSAPEAARLHLYGVSASATVVTSYRELPPVVCPFGLYQVILGTIRACNVEGKREWEREGVSAREMDSERRIERARARRDPGASTISNCVATHQQPRRLEDDASIVNWMFFRTYTLAACRECSSRANFSSRDPAKTPRARDTRESEYASHRESERVHQDHKAVVATFRLADIRSQNRRKSYRWE